MDPVKLDVCYPESFPGEEFESVTENKNSQTPGEQCLTFQNLTYKVVSGPKKKRNDVVILKSMNGIVNSGELVAIMGSTGAGKTTLLNCLAGRIQTGSLEGEILFHGRPRDPRAFKRDVGYVQQDDLLFATLTVRETLLYAASLRLDSKKYTKKQKETRVDEVMRQLRLTHIANSMIGDERSRGISGGERKRVSIGLELVVVPELLMLDEPTSGLDSNSSEVVCELLQELCRNHGKTILLSIHQPNAKIFKLFDKIILLGKGGMVYCDNAANANDYFSGIGYQMPLHENPADFYIDLMTLDTRTDTAMTKSRERLSFLISTWKSREATREGPIRAELSKSGNGSSFSVYTENTNWANSWGEELRLLVVRSWTKVIRDKQYIISLFFQASFMVVVIGAVFFQLSNDIAGVQSRIGLFFFLLIQVTFPIIMPQLGLLLGERAIMLRERSSGAYRMSTFLISKLLTSTPIQLCSTIVLLTGIYFAAGLQYVFSKYIIFMALYLNAALCSLSFAWAISAIAPTMEIAQILAPVLLTFVILFGGNLANSDTIPSFLAWIKYLSFHYYTYQAAVQNEFTGLEIQCSPAPGAPCYGSGEDVINAYNLNGLPIYANYLITLFNAFLFFLIAYALLRFKAKPKFIWV